MLHKDEWLSTYFLGGAYRVEKPYGNLVFPSGFFYTKVLTENIQAVGELINDGFKLVEILVIFKQQVNISCIEDKILNIGWAQSEDRENVIEIARNAFGYSRFSRDDRISPEIASAIKADWVANFFNGKRGTKMIVARQDNKVVGFILLINNIIDLIAVDSRASRQGIATKMISFANKEVGLLTAGTQIINQPSMAMYQKLNFCVTHSQLTLHKHVV